MAPKFAALRSWRIAKTGLSFGVPTDPFNPNLPIQLEGKLLIADPSLRDGTFNKSVILLTDHSADGGAFGLILNHPTGKVVGDFLQDEEFAPLKKLAVHKGGPVSHDQMTFSSFWWSRKLGLRWAIRISAGQSRPTRRAGREESCAPSSATRDGPQASSNANSGGPRGFPSTRRPTCSATSTIPRCGPRCSARMSPLHRILAEAPDDPFLN